MRAIVRKDISNSYFTLRKGTEVEVVNEWKQGEDIYIKVKYYDNYMISSLDNFEIILEGN